MKDELKFLQRLLLTMSTNRVFLNDIKKLRVAYEMHELSSIKSMDFNYNGEHIAYNTNNLLSILSCSEESVRRSSIRTDKFGAGLCKFFGNDHVVYTSTVHTHHIRLLDLKDELKSMNFFPGRQRCYWSTQPMKLSDINSRRSLKSSHVS